MCEQNNRTKSRTLINSSKAMKLKIKNMKQVIHSLNQSTFKKNKNKP